VSHVPVAKNNAVAVDTRSTPVTIASVNMQTLTAAKTLSNVVLSILKLLCLIPTKYLLLQKIRKLLMMKMVIDVALTGKTLLLAVNYMLNAASVAMCVTNNVLGF